MNAIRVTDASPLRSALVDLIDRHGFRAIALAVLGLALRPRVARGSSLHDLSDHLRRDIGLPPYADDRDPRRVG